MQEWQLTGVLTRSSERGTGERLEQRKRVTRADVARLARVSLPVVSYVLNDGPKNVSDETRQRVMDAVRALGYQPNAAARALRRGKSSLLGFVIPNIGNPLFATFAREVEIAAARHDVTLMTLSAPVGSVHQAIERLAAHQVDGVIVATQVRVTDIAAIERSLLPAVLLNQLLAFDGIPTFGVDLYGGARTAVDHLVSLGHAVIGYLGPDDASSRRLQGWRDALRSHGLREGPIAHSGFTRSEGYEAARSLLAARDDVTALFASSDQIAVGALRALHEAGLAVPDEIAMVSFDDSPEAEYAWPPLTAVSQPIRQMAEDAVDRVLGGAGAEHRRYDVELVVRAST